MFRMFMFQCWLSLSDEGLEDAIYDSYTMHKFMYLDFLDERVPDATMLCKRWKLVVDNGIDKLFLSMHLFFIVNIIVDKARFFNMFGKFAVK